MGRSLTIRQGRLVLEGRIVTGDLVVEDGIISQIAPRIDRAVGEEIPGHNLVVLPGCIDPLVFVETVEDLSSVSGTAAAGGYTAICAAGPADTTVELRLECQRALETSRVHCGLYVRATTDNLSEIRDADRARGVFVSGEIFYDDTLIESVLAASSKLVVVENRDPKRAEDRLALYEHTTDPVDHARINDIDGVVAATTRAVDLAARFGREMLLSHVSTAEEIAIIAPPLAEDSPETRRSPVLTVVRPHHLFLDESDCLRLGTRSVCSPPVRGPRHMGALWEALLDGRLDGISTGHRAVRSEWKDRLYPTTDMGMPSIQFVLPLLADAVNRGRCTWLDVARFVSGGPARLLKLPRKGRLEVGYDGDLVLVDTSIERTIGTSAAISAPGWSPWEGKTLAGWPVITAILGEIVYRDGEVMMNVRGRSL